MSIFGKQKRVARPLQGYQPRAIDSGSLGLRGPYAMRGLGSSAAPGEIPWQCWGIQSFQDCHAANFAKNQQTCTSDFAAQYGMTVDDCVNSYTAGDDAGCVTANCSQYAAIANQTAALPAATVKAAQTQLNKDLAAAGLKAIAVDGKLGPATCGAASYMYNSSPRQSTAWTDYNLYAYCGSIALTNPTLVGASTPLQSQVASTTTIIAGQQPTVAPTPQWGVSDPTVAALQVTLNAILVQNGYMAIPVSGMLDAQTCGAMRWVKANTGQDYLFSSGANCQSFIDPTKNKVGPVIPGQQQPSGPIPSGGISSASMLTGGLLLLALGGGYYYAKKKGMV